MSDTKPRPRIVLNAAKCKGCERMLVSLHTHDYRACPCGNAVDGGREYLKRTGRPEDLEDRTIMAWPDGSWRELGWEPREGEADARA